MASSSSNVVGVHYRVGKKIGEGSFGVIFEGTNLLNNQQVAIKFVCCTLEVAVAKHKQQLREEKWTLRRRINKCSQFPLEQEPRKSDAPQLRDEYRTYKILVGCRKCLKFLCESRDTNSISAGIPNVYYFGQEGLHNILVIDLLGPSLEDLFDHCNRRFTIKTVVMVAKQMVGNFHVYVLCDANVHAALKSANNSREESHLS